MSLHKQRTAGRVVEGARLERGCRVTYLGFESLAVHHDSQNTLNNRNIGASSTIKSRQLNNYDTFHLNNDTSTTLRLYKVGSIYYYRRKVNKKLYRISLRTQNLKIAMYRRKLFELMNKEEFMYTIKFQDYEYIFEYDSEEEFKKRYEDTLKLHKELLGLEIQKETELDKYRAAKKSLNDLSKRETITWSVLEAKFIQKQKELDKVSKSTYKAWASAFKKLQTYFGKKTLDSLSIEDYEEFRNFLKREYKIKNKTINNTLKYANKFINFAVSRKLIKENVLVGLESLTEEAVEKENYTDEEVLEIFNYPYELKDYKYIFMIGAYSGMRVHEICNLTNEDIKKEDDIYYFNITKSKTKNGIRKVPIHENILDTILKIDFPLLKDKRTVDAKEKAILRQLYKVVDKNSTKSFHTLRAKFISKVIEALPDKLLILQEIVGHSKSKNTELTVNDYGKGFPLYAKKEVVNAVNYS